MKGAIAVLLVLIPAAAALKCYSGTDTTRNGTNNVQIPLIECNYGYLSCTKYHDTSSGQYNKACSMSNCTIPNQPYVSGPAVCTSNPSNIAGITGTLSQCCCYGDGCNAGRGESYMIAAVFSVVAGFLMF